jgi:glycosyltransferase involved in cell wall biosynthesis
MAAMTADTRASISVIVPTQARAERASQLLRALDSIVSQAGTVAVPIVIINGAERDPALVAALGRRTDLRLATLDTADLPAALRVGRSLVDTPYFAELGDDDVLLPNAFVRQLEAARAEPRADVIVANGIVRDPNERLVIQDLAAVSADPLRALVAGNWLVPGAALFRTDRVPARLFDGMPHHLEWTYLAVRLTAHCRLHFINRATYVHSAGTPYSPRVSREFALGLPGALTRILELDLPADIRTIFERKLAAACHHAADSELRAGYLGSALHWHLRSLLKHRDWRRLPFGRKFLTAMWRPQRRSPAA